MPHAPVQGFADLHCHVMAHLGFGGRVVAGLPDGPLEKALARCDPWPHGPGGIGNLGKGWTLTQALIEQGVGHGPCGHETYRDWPNFGTRIHQQAYVDWLRRAHDGGLRLLCSLAVNNELLAEEFGHPDSDGSAIQKQVEALHRFCARHADWMGLALSPSHARALVAEGKLAVVAGVEVDSLDSVLGDRRAVSREGLPEGRVGAILDWLRAAGVRMLTPLHLSDNSFGGAAIYDELFNLLNHALRGRYYAVRDAEGLAFRLGPGGRLLQEWAAIAYYGLKHWTRYPSYRAPAGGHGHANARGLTPAGAHLLEEAMRRGFVLDVDHMSELTTDQALSLAEARDYPVVSSHSGFRELAPSPAHTKARHKHAHEGQKTREQARRILRLGGVLAPISNQGDELVAFPGASVPNDCARSSLTWAQAYLYAVALQREVGRGGVAVGTDFNGLAQQPGPRYGERAAFGLDGERGRELERKRQRAAQQARPRLAYEGTLLRSSAPFVQARSGGRTWDFNTDGLAHYGLLPDMLRDLVHVGMREEELDPLFSSAEAFLRAWEKCEQRAEALREEAAA